MPSHYCLAFLFKELQMKATIQTRLNALCESIITLHGASKDYKVELTKFTPIYNDATPDEQVEIRNTVAKLVGKLYGAKPIKLKTGTLGFERTSAESKFLRRILPVDKVSTKKPKKTTRKSVDKVDKAVNLYESMSKIERRRFLTQIGQ
jgi:hypothetical protein